MATHTYEVTVEAGEDGPPPELVERWAKVATYRLEVLEEREGHYPAVGGSFDMLDNLEGKFFWEMTDEELEANPPTAVYFDIVSVDPAEPPTDDAPVKVTVSVPL